MTVSFIVPTLNRGRHVVRAVESCLIAGDTAEEAVEVIVLDSQSDDGSWEALCDRFGSNDRVRLLQNERGLGPTRSWLDAAAHVTGEFVTFVWSDDYIAPSFILATKQGLASRDQLVIGAAVVRDIDDDSGLPPSRGVRREPVAKILAAYFSLPSAQGTPAPVSPTCSLFTREAFDAWMAQVPDYCRSTDLRNQLLWRRAIGPDLMLYLQALSQQDDPVILLDDTLAQFSEHETSISIGSPQWNLVAGYWLARAWFTKTGLHSTRLSPEQKSRLIGRTILHGLRLALTAPAHGPLGSRAEIRKAMMQEVREVHQAARRYGLGGSSMLRVLTGGVRETVARRHVMPG